MQVLETEEKEKEKKAYLSSIISFVNILQYTNESATCQAATQRKLSPNRCKNKTNTTKRVFFLKLGWPCGKNGSASCI